MTAEEFYNKRVGEDCTIGSIRLMEEYADFKLKKTNMTKFNKSKLAHKWANERSEGDREVDRQCYYDYLMGLEEAERQLK